MLSQFMSMHSTRNEILWFETLIGTGLTVMIISTLKILSTAASFH